MPQEEKLLEILIDKASINMPKDWKNQLLVRPMNDGEMGSLLLFPEGTLGKQRIFGEQVSDYQFTDIDGVEVIASLNVDTEGALFELDIWKTNFEKLLIHP